MCIGTKWNIAVIAFHFKCAWNDEMLEWVVIVCGECGEWNGRRGCDVRQCDVMWCDTGCLMLTVTSQNYY